MTASTPHLGTPSSCSAALNSDRAGARRPRDVRSRYRRGYLPHFDVEHACQFVTFRLADSLPKAKLRELEAEICSLPDGKRDQERRRRIEAWLDSGAGCCALAHPAVAQVMQDTLRHFDGQRYQLLAWCIMPNHVHVLVETLASLAKIVQSWKSFTGRWALQHAAELGLGVPNQAGLRLDVHGRAFWMRDYWDRYIRNERHFHAVVSYIHANPVNAGLCRHPADWRWSSAPEQTAVFEVVDGGVLASEAGDGNEAA